MTPSSALAVLTPDTVGHASPAAFCGPDVLMLRRMHVHSHELSHTHPHIHSQVPTRSAASARPGPRFATGQVRGLRRPGPLVCGRPGPRLATGLARACGRHARREPGSPRDTLPHPVAPRRMRRYCGLPAAQGGGHRHRTSRMLPPAGPDRVYAGHQLRREMALIKIDYHPAGLSSMPRHADSNKPPHHDSDALIHSGHEVSVRRYCRNHRNGRQVTRPNSHDRRGSWHRPR